MQNANKIDDSTDHSIEAVGSLGGEATDVSPLVIDPEAVGYEAERRPYLVDWETRMAMPLIMRVRDTRGKFLTTALFHETVAGSSRYAPLYTLMEFDKPSVGLRPFLPSARKIYLDIADPTEYEAAMALLGSWEHWCYLCGVSWFKPHIETWRSDLQTKLKSRSVAIARELALGDDAVALSAAKWLHTQLSPRDKGGRPKKIPTPTDLTDQSTTDTDYARIMEKLAEDINVG